MSTTSPIYLMFIAGAALLYYLIPAKYQNAFLFVVSLIFYVFAIPAYLLFILGTVVISWWSALQFERTNKKLFLIVPAFAAIAVLFFFKYFNFTVQIITDISSILGGELRVNVLSLSAPLGISFYTFQTIGYLVDVGKGKVNAEKSLIDFGLFTTFFPAIVAGPIGRASELLPQYKSERVFSYGSVVAGLQRFLTGAFRKMVLADGIAIIVNPIISNAASYCSLTVLAAVFLYNCQIYCDFAGYSEMAIGVAQIFGIQVRENFRAPFFATDITEFWKRWHMSLTEWFRDYIYIPLGGNRKGFTRKLINILIVFIVSGVWHGAAYGYIIWGLLHGLVRILEEWLRASNPSKYLQHMNSPLMTIVGRVRVFAFVAFAFIFFTLKAGEILPAIGALTFSPRTAYNEILYLASNQIASGGVYILLYFGILVAGLLLMIVGDHQIYAMGTSNPLSLLPTVPRWALYWFMGLSVCWFYMIAKTGGAGSVSFIYAGF